MTEEKESGMERSLSGQTGLAIAVRPVALLWVLPLLCLCGCGSHSASGVHLAEPVGEWLGHGSCLPPTLGAGRAQTPDELDCLKWEYDGEGFLQVTHANAGMNCEPVIEAAISVGPSPGPGFAGTILIVENELYDSVNCYCLFELDYTVSDLPPGRYWVEVQEEEDCIFPEDEPLQFELELDAAGVDSFCVVRDHYPWDSSP
jgi:hypothetical protein